MGDPVTSSARTIMCSTVRLLAAVSCLTVSLPMAASEQREAALRWPQVQHEAQFRQMGQLLPSDRAAHGTYVRVSPQGQPLTMPEQDTSAWLDRYMDQHHLAGVMVLHTCAPACGAMC